MTVTLATFMEVLDSSIANVALPHIAGGLGATQDEATWVLTAYLVANAADHAANVESRAIMESLAPGEVPARITKVPYIAALHAAVLDPLWNGTPRPKTLTECGVCHDEVGTGNYKTRIFHVTDDAFSGK